MTLRLLFSFDSDISIIPSDEEYQWIDDHSSNPVEDDQLIL